MLSTHILTILRACRLTGLARTTFGLYGAYLPVLLLVFENVIFVSYHN